MRDAASCKAIWSPPGSVRMTLGRKVVAYNTAQDPELCAQETQPKSSLAAAQRCFFLTTARANTDRNPGVRRANWTLSTGGGIGCSNSWLEGFMVTPGSSKEGNTYDTHTAVTVTRRC